MSEQNLENKLKQTKNSLNQVRRANQVLSSLYEQKANEAIKTVTEYFSTFNDEVVNHVLQTTATIGPISNKDTGKSTGFRHGELDIETLNGLKETVIYKVRITNMFPETSSIESTDYEITTGAESIGKLYNRISLYRKFSTELEQEVKSNEETMRNARRKSKKKLEKTNQNSKITLKEYETQIKKLEAEINNFDDQTDIQGLPHDIYHMINDNTIYLVDTATEKPIYKFEVYDNFNEKPHEISSEVVKEASAVKEILQQQLFKQTMHEQNYNLAKQMMERHMNDTNKDIYVNEIIKRSYENPVAISKVFKQPEQRD
ncbi:MAG: hypothetical protein ACOCU6_00910 [Nanoarchaeota archaeon]